MTRAQALQAYKEAVKAAKDAYQAALKKALQEYNAAKAAAKS
jgi:Arc/MetJ family transcription regulator